MHWQTFITGLIVSGCTLYAAWRLMPAGLRGRLLLLMGRPAAAAGGACGGGCDGCGSGAAKPGTPGGAAVIKIVRQPRAAASR